MELIVTDVTEMAGDVFCVAGWDSKQHRMVRPLPGGHHWQRELVAQLGIAPGQSIGCELSRTPPTGTFPHRSEDTSVDTGSIRNLSMPAISWFGDGAPPTVDTLQTAFEGHIQHTRIWNGARKGVFVTEGTITPSLNAVRVPSSQFSFTVDGKLRAVLQDGDARYDLPVVSHLLLEKYRKGGLEILNGMLSGVGDLHVRVGLARSWEGRPGHCYAMINGVFW
jgi:hypothetical protein